MQSYHLFKKAKDNSTEIQSYWLSFSDLMAGVLIIFILFFVMKINSEIKLRRIFQELYQVKGQIVVEIKEAFRDKKNIEILEDGTVRFFIEETSKQWFEVGDSKLMDAGKEEINEFARKYISILFLPKYLEYIDKIEIEGHTDSTGKNATEQESYLYNLHLSQKRAYNVAEFIHKNVLLSDDEKTNLYYKELLREKLSASGRSFIDLIREDGGEENQLRSRRVEFNFSLPMEKKYLEFRDSN